MIDRWLTSPLAGPIAIGVGVLLSGALLVAGIKVGFEARRADAAEARADDAIDKITRPGTGWAARLESCRAGAQQLKAGIEQQNAAVAALKAEAAQRAQMSAKALQQARQASRAADSRITSLLNRQPQSGDYCEQASEAEKLIRETIR